MIVAVSEKETASFIIVQPAEFCCPLLDYIARV